ncbi:MAG: phosphomethylpyrimidine synthase [Methanobrevibacter boviskoreani]|jgi:phosphomethylpyrimidine synthase|uniref:phosphomethylpyrimidine synthase n=1 Tax=Methanobrevibacter boviskoreani TaxID=1348249 RepID=UPI00059521BC|nr:phosphomethylpyrimidine synthase [Methanobrevibacter boviskoreani]MCI6775720.1 phosphomethylpyrimidine synthase [Methanobrevibacter boviskoreani]MCI6931182.1 phosphomethylpyrimidine synthase [Methanobrevibacter boviskoreani]MDY5615210.1 phosphomethylpyrimidine synthase [Methanobrevibacter boviskoreani]
MTQMTEALKGNITPEMETVAKFEEIDVNKILRGVANGTIVIPKNVNRDTDVRGIGTGLTTKVNANIGSSTKIEDLDLEVNKAKLAVEYGADAVMDLSTGPKLNEFRKAILDAVDIPIGTVPIYEAGAHTLNANKEIIDMDPDLIFKVIESQAKEGVDFMTLHCGITKELVPKIQSQKRKMGIVSRGGTFLASWILHNNMENPLYENYDYLLELALEYDITLSLGDGLRPGCLSDASDIPQIQELVNLGGLVKRAQKVGVQTMVEGPGHVPLNQIKSNMELEKTLCHGAPFYVLGPITTDLAPGYDHITSAIGGAIAASNGADFLCYVTPAEHLSLPSLEDVKEGVIAAKIAAEAADVALGNEKALKREEEMADARRKFDWDKQFELAFDKSKPRVYKDKCEIEDKEMCAMCGEFCAVKIAKNDF